MSSQIQLADEDLNANMVQLEQAVAKTQATVLGPEKKQEEALARKQWKVTRSALNAFHSEIRKIEDPTQKSVFQRKFQEYDQQLKSLDKDLRAAMRPPKADAAAKKKERPSHEEQIMGEGGEDGAGFKTATQVLQAGQRVQTDSLKSLQRSERLQNTAEETGRETLQVLATQTEKIHRIDEELDTMQGQLDRAKRDVIWFARNLAGDKCFMCLFLTVVLCLVIVVFWKVYDRRSSGKAGATPAPAIQPPSAGSGARHMQALGGAAYNGARHLMRRHLGNN